jgi:hypothetical protein
VEPDTQRAWNAIGSSMKVVRAEARLKGIGWIAEDEHEGVEDA